LAILVGQTIEERFLALLGMTALGKLQQEFRENWQSRRDMESKKKRDSSLRLPAAGRLGKTGKKISAELNAWASWAQHAAPLRGNSG
jgi:hypothetical protein